MNPIGTMRVARPTNNLAQIAEMYAEGLGFSVLARFEGHDGFDGVILGDPQVRYHLEFTSEAAHTVAAAPDKEHLLVFYIANEDEWGAACARMLGAGFQAVSSYNPYWDVHGRTFEDVDGYRVVLNRGEWRE